MSIKWKLFSTANIVFLSAYLLLFGLAIGFAVEQLRERKEFLDFVPFMASLLITILNSAFNIYVAHKHLPDKPLSRRIRTAYFISAIVFAISFIIISVSLIGDINDNPTSRPADNFFYFMVSIFILNSFTGIFILLNQFVITKYIEKNYKDSFDRQIEDIGK